MVGEMRKCLGEIRRKRGLATVLARLAGPGGGAHRWADMEMGTVRVEKGAIRRVVSCAVPRLRRWA